MQAVVRAAVIASVLGARLEAASGQATPASTGADERTLELLFREEPTVSVVTTWEEPISAAPGTVVVITEQEIRERGYRDLMDIFHDLPGVDISLYSIGSLPSGIFVRGVDVTLSKLVVLRDGVTMNLPATFPKIGRNIPLYNVKRIEVLYGPASVLYGSDAVGAVVQLISKEPGEGFSVEAESSAGSFDPLQGFHRYAFDGHLLLASRWKSVTLMGTARTYQSSGPQLLESYPQDFAPIASQPAPFTNRFEAPIRSWNAEAALTSGDVTAGGFFTDHSWPSWLGGSPRLFPYISDNVFRYRFYQAFVRHDTRQGAFDLHTVATYGAMQTVSPSPVILVNGPVLYRFQEQQSLRLDHRTAWAIRPWLTASAGIRFQTFSVVPLKGDLPAPVETGGQNLADLGLGHVIFNRYGLFALAEVLPWKDLKFTAGVSFEHDGDSGENVVVPRGGVVLGVFGGAGSVKALYGEGFVAPLPDQKYLSSLSPGSAAFFPNPDLKSERSRTVELRYEHRFARTFSGEVGAYYNRLTGLEQLVVGGPVTVDGITYPMSASFQNFGVTWSAGGEASARVSPLSWLRVSASYALVFGKETLPPSPGGAASPTDLAKVARHKVLAGITVRPFRHWVADARLRWVSDVATRPTNAQFMGQPMPGYYDLNFNLRAEDIVPGIDAHLLVENLTDNRYYHFGTVGEGREFLPRTPQPPFRFLVGMTYRR